MQIITVSPVFVKSSLKGAIRRGYNPEEILRGQGLPPQILTNPKLRISIFDYAKLSHALTQLMRDEAIGLLDKPQVPGTFRLMAKACLSNRTICESLITWRDSINLIDNSMRANTRIQEQSGYFAIDCDIAAKIDDNYIIESALTTFHRFHCWLANEFIPIERVDLTYPEPEFSDEYRFVFYGAPVYFNQRRNAIHLSRQSLDLACQRSIDDLEIMLKHPFRQILTQSRQGNSESIKVRLWMEKVFREGGGPPQLSEASKHIGISEQTLRRRLKAENYSFQQLKENTRRDMAIYYIQKKQNSVENIAFQLGFSEASTFIRAFKKWTGLTPLVYRKLYS